MIWKISILFSIVEYSTWLIYFLLKVLKLINMVYMAEVIKLILLRIIYLKILRNFNKGFHKNYLFIQQNLIMKSYLYSISNIMKGHFSKKLYFIVIFIFSLNICRNDKCIGLLWTSNSLKSMKNDLIYNFVSF